MCLPYSCQRRPKERTKDEQHCYNSTLDTRHRKEREKNKKKKPSKQTNKQSNKNKKAKQNNTKQTRDSVS